MTAYLSLISISILVGIYLAYRAGRLPPPSAAPAGSKSLLRRALDLIKKVMGPSSPAPSPALPPQAGSSPDPLPASAPTPIIPGAQ